MFKKILVAIVILLAAVLGAASFQPDTFHVERTVSIQAPPEKIFPLINNLHRFNTWSPFVEPGMKDAYTGPENGPGAKYSWEGKQMGVGSSEITESVAPSKVIFKLSFVKPFQAQHTAQFTLTPNGQSTSVTWSLDGSNTFLCKVIHLFVSMDSMCGKEFEKGLAGLKALAEK